MPARSRRTPEGTRDASEAATGESANGCSAGAQAPTTNRQEKANDVAWVNGVRCITIHLSNPYAIFGRRLFGVESPLE